MKIFAEGRHAGLSYQVRATFEHDDLNAERWTFEYQERHHLAARMYEKLERQSKRHNWRQVESFGNWDKRQDTLKAMPDVPQAVAAKAYHEFVGALKVDGFN